MEKLVIDRETWGRGKNTVDGNSYLIHPKDGKMCCLGFLAIQRGIEKQFLVGMGAPSDVQHDTQNQNFPKWLFAESDPGCTSSDAGTLMFINDTRLGGEIYRYVDSRSQSKTIPIPDEATREKLIAEIFAKHGIEVEFIN